MKLSKFTVILAVLLISIMAIGAVSAESLDDSGIATPADGDVVQISDVDDAIEDVPVATGSDDENNVDAAPLSEGEINNYEINNDTYSTYFNEDGTTTDALSAMGDYNLTIDTITNKKIKIDSGSNINIIGKEGSGFINNGTIIIGDGEGSVGSILISGLTFTNFNKNSIVVNELSNKVTIENNKFDLTYDNSFDGSTFAIVTYGYVDEVNIINNEISMDSANNLTYGISLFFYTGDENGHIGEDSGMANAEHFNVRDNIIDIVSTSTASYAMAEGMYIDTLCNSVFTNNQISVTTAEGIFNYGMQIADTWGFYYGCLSPNNITISENEVFLKSADMAYGITAISLWPYDGMSTETPLILNIVIANNNVTILSDSGAMGIGVMSSDAEITGNNIYVYAHPENPVTPSSEMLGYDSYAILLSNDLSDLYMPNAHNNTVKDNVIISNLESIKVIKNDSSTEPLVIEDNTIIPFITDESYSIYFDENGKIKDDAPISPNDILYIGELTNKNLVIDMPLNIKGGEGNVLVNTTIAFVTDSDGSSVSGLTMIYDDDGSATFAIISVNEGASNILIADNKITTVSAPGWNYNMAISVYGSPDGSKNITITGNTITMTGSSGGLYAIDVQNMDPSFNKLNGTDGLIITNNVINISSTGMVEPIYIYCCENILVEGNSISSTSSGTYKGNDVYGIGTGNNNNMVIKSNDIKVSSAMMGYGISSTYNTNTVFENNDISVVGTGAVGIGIQNSENVKVDNNKVAIDGGDDSSIETYDTIGTANAAIFVADGNKNIESSGNDVTELSAVRLNSAIEVSDLTVSAAPSGNGTLQFTLKTTGGMVLANQVVKVVFNNQMYELTTDANGVAKLSFVLNKAGTYNVEFFYLGDDNYRGSDATAKIKINKIATKTTSAAKTYLATASSKAISATLKDAKGNVLANKKVTFTVNGKTYTATTNAKGVATVKLALTAAKTYTVSIKFAGDSVYDASTVSAKVKLNKEATKINAPAKTFKRKAKTKKVVITLRNSKNKVVANKKVVLTVNKKNYTVKTNKKGQATFNIKLTKKGTFKYTVKFAGDSQYKAVKKTGKIKIK